MRQVTQDDIKQILRDCAGVDDPGGLDGDVADVPLGDLGYDSLALLETASRVERQFGVSLPEAELADVGTLRSFVDLVNGRLGAAA